MWQRKGEWHSFWHVVVTVQAEDSHAPHPLLETWITKQDSRPSAIAWAWANAAHASSPGKLTNFPRMKLQQQSRSWVNPGALIDCLLQTTVLQCQSHKAKGRHSIQKKTSISKLKTMITERRPQTSQGQARSAMKCLNAEHSRNVFSLWHFNEK